MAQSFEDKVRERAEAARKAASQTNPFWDVLTAFANGLSSPEVNVRMVRSQTDSRRAHLVASPAHRPNRGSALLSFLIGDGAVLFGEKQRPIQKPEELESALIQLLETSPLLESIGTLAALVAEPVEAYLRYVSAKEISRDDVLVEVPPAEQAKLDAAPAGTQVKLLVRQSSFPGAGRVDIDKQAVALDAAGLFLENLTVTLSGDDVTVEGTKR